MLLKTSRLARAGFSFLEMIMAKPEYHYGIHAITALLESQPEQVLGLFLLSGRADQALDTIAALAQKHGVAVQRVGRETLDRLTEQGRHQGVVANVRPIPVLDEQDLLGLLTATPVPLLLALDEVSDPHNLGACLRSAAAMGATAVVVPRDRSSGLTPTVRKVAAGAVEQIPLVQVGNLARCIELLKQNGVWVVGTLLDEAARPLSRCDLTQPVMVVMGAEGHGLRRLTRERCDELAYIPMSGRLQSLNVSVAAGMVLYEACRQRAQA